MNHQPYIIQLFGHNTYYILGFQITVVYITKRKGGDSKKCHHFRSFIKNRIPGYAVKNSNKTQRRFFLPKSKIILIVKQLLRQEVVLEYRHQAQTQNVKPLWWFVFIKSLEKHFISLKCIILILTIFIHFSCESNIFTRSE